MKSLHELRTELIGVRLSAANHSLWAIGAEVSERARVSLNDAIGSYKFRVTEQYTSIQLDPDGVVVVLPLGAKRVLEIHGVTDSGFGRSPLVHYRHVPTPMTNLLYLKDYVSTYSGVELDYEARLEKFPKDLLLNATLDTSTLSAVEVTDGTPAAHWISPGYIEITPTGTTDDTREIIRYEMATPTGFTGLTRKVEGVLRNWSGSAVVSMAAPVPDDAVPTIMAAAKASMYEFWITHQVLYTQWSAAAGIRELSVEELAGLIRTDEDRADRRYRKVRQVPKPTYVKKRRKPY